MTLVGPTFLFWWDLVILIIEGEGPRENRMVESENSKGFSENSRAGSENRKRVFDNRGSM